MQRVDEMQAAPVPGKFYLVPTLQYEWHGMTGVWPVLGPKHEDREIINFPHAHYHLDGRFLTKRQRDFAAWGVYTFEVQMAGKPIMQGAGMPELPSVVYRRRKCWTPRVKYVTETTYDLDRRERTHWIYDLREAFQGRHLIKSACGVVCPHRGAHLGSIPPDAHGVITCPLHGLRFNANTGESVL